MTASDLAKFAGAVAELKELETLVEKFKVEMEALALEVPEIAAELEKKRGSQTPLEEYLAFRVSALAAIVCFHLLTFHNTARAQERLD